MLSLAGRASQRLQEVAQFEPSSTIHRLLQYKAAGARPTGPSAESDEEEELEGRYKYCRSQPLETQAVLVDEAAMLDISLAAALLEALDPNTQLILVGEILMPKGVLQFSESMYIVRICISDSTFAPKAGSAMVECPRSATVLLIDRPWSGTAKIWSICHDGVAL
jgi:hypothetical protein